MKMSGLLLADDALIRGLDSNLENSRKSHIADRDKMIAGVMAAILATQGTAWASAWALGVGLALNLFLSNWHPFRKGTGE